MESDDSWIDRDRLEAVRELVRLIEPVILSEFDMGELGTVDASAFPEMLLLPYALRQAATAGGDHEVERLMREFNGLRWRVSRSWHPVWMARVHWIAIECGARSADILAAMITWELQFCIPRSPHLEEARSLLALEDPTLLDSCAESLEKYFRYEVFASGAIGHVY